MSRWENVAEAAPELAECVRLLFEARRHKTLATLRRDGSPRISGIETRFEAGELCLGMMAGSLKALDLRRDPRLALHSPNADPPEDNPSDWVGEAKISGLAIEVPNAEGDVGSHRFRVDVTEVVLTTIASEADRLIIESWHPERGLETRERR